MAKFSVFIIAKNEANRIASAIGSVKNIADEVIVIDSGSTDNTVQIAQELGAKVVFNEWSGYVAQKAFGENLCRNDWILNIDADEELSPQLQNEIEFIFASNLQDKYLAYQINFVIMHPSDKKPRFFAPANKFIRIYNRTNCSFAGHHSTTHDAVVFKAGIESKGRIFDLESIAYHRSGTSIEQMVAKANFYSSQQAEDLIKIGRNPSRMRIACEPFLWFFKAYFIRRYFVFGFDGFVHSMIFAFARFIRLAKVREMRRK